MQTRKLVTTSGALIPWKLKDFSNHFLQIRSVWILFLIFTCRIIYLLFFLLFSRVVGRILSQFNKMGEYNLQNVYLRGLIERQPVKKRGNRGCDGRAEDGKGNAKNYTYQYYVQTPALQCVQVRLVIASCIIFPRFRKHLFYHNFY